MWDQALGRRAMPRLLVVPSVGSSFFIHVLSAGFETSLQTGSFLRSQGPLGPSRLVEGFRIDWCRVAVECVQQLLQYM